MPVVDKKATPLGPVKKTARGFQIIDFEDRYRVPCSLQQSSIFSDENANNPGATAVWLGVDRRTEQPDPANPTRMHLDRNQVQSLIAVLEMWLQTGEFAE